MFRLFVWFFLLFLVACSQDPQQEIIQGNASLNTSFSLTEDTLIWNTNDQTPNLVVETDQAIDLDFGGAVIQSALLGESPDQYQGTAILIKKAPKVTIRNARFVGFKNGIVVEMADSVLLSNCAFVDFTRDTINNIHSAAVQVKQAQLLAAEDCLFQHLSTAIEVEKETTLSVSHSKFHWLTHRVLQTGKGESVFEDCQFFYIGFPEKENPPFISGRVSAFRQNSMAQVLNPDHLIGKLGDLNPAAYINELPEAQWSAEWIDQQLRDLGIATPGLLLTDQWGWYDYSYPKVWQREQTSEKDIYLVTAPNGNWRLVGGQGYSKIVPKTGSFPTTVQAFPDTEGKTPSLEFEYLGKKVQKYGALPPKAGPITFSTQD